MANKDLALEIIDEGCKKVEADYIACCIYAFFVISF